MEKEHVDNYADDAPLLEGDIVRLFNSHFKETLDILSSRFPHVSGDNSQNEVEFKGLRAKVLRSGNNKLRKLPEILTDFSIIKTFDTVVETKEVNTPIKVK